MNSKWERWFKKAKEKATRLLGRAQQRSDEQETRCAGDHFSRCAKYRNSRLSQ